jgi:hypothetical protein
MSHRDVGRAGRVVVGIAGAPMALIIVLAVCASGSGPASAGSHRNLLQNPKFEIPNAGGKYFVECSGVTPCGPATQDEVAAANWIVDVGNYGTGGTWMTTDLTRSTAPKGGHYMLHATSDGGGLVGQAGLSPITSGSFSVWVFPVMEPVVACANHGGDSIYCQVDAVLGQWKDLSMSFSGAISIDEYLVGSCTPAQLLTTSLTCPGPPQYTPPVSSAPPYGDFYVDNATLTSS